MLRKTFASSLIMVLACSILFSVSIKSVSASSGTNQIFWGAFVGPSHIGTLAELTAFENYVGKGVSIWSTFQFWDRPQDSENDPNFDTAWMNTCRAHGAIPEIAFNPGDGSTGVIAATYFPLIIAGNYDSYLANWARNTSAWGHPFFIRLFHEVDDNPWTATLEQEEVQAWQHVVNIFREYGANNVSWIWSGVCYMHGNSQVAQATYPGDNYVDWLGIAGYGSATWNSMFSSYYSESLSIAANKPIMIVELGYSGSDPSSWWSDALQNELPNNYPQIKALVIWQQEYPLPSSDLGSGIASSYVTAFQQGIALSYYSSNVYGSLNISPIIAIGGIPNSATYAPSPTSTSIHSPAVSSGFNRSAAIIVGVITAVAVVLVVLKSSKKRERTRRMRTPSQKTAAK